MLKKSMSWIFLLVLLFSFPAVAAQVHEVSRQDSLYQLSRWYGVSVEELGRTNNLKAPYTIYPGQVIIVPSPKAKAGEKLYRVTRGDSLYAIASRFQTTTSRIIQENGLSGAELYAEQVLRIPVTQTPTQSHPKTQKKATQPAKNVYYYNIPDLMRAFPGRIF